MMADAEPDKQADASEASGEAKDAVAAPGKKELPGKSHPRKHRRRKKHGPWVLMLIVIIAVAAIWVFMPTGMRQDVSGLLTQTKPQKEAEAPKIVKTVAPAPSRVIPPPPPPPPSVSSEEVEALRDSIRELKNNLQELRDESIALRQTMGERQLPDIRARLNWISNPASTLDQIYFAWSDIAVAAGIDDEQRAEAGQMRDMAARHWQERREWASALESVSESLMREGHEEAGEPGEATLQASFMQWVKDNFYLGRSDAGARMAAAELNKRLLQAIRAIKGEQWPEGEAWQQMVVSMRESGLQTSGLPNDFAEIRSDIDTMRSKAREWLERL